jgi:putative metallohydrolase (TIGR04338 family)
MTFWDEDYWEERPLRRDRDGQKQKVYESEWAIDSGRIFWSADEVSAYVNKLYNSAWYQRRWKNLGKGVTIKWRNKTGTSRAFSYKREIRFASALFRRSDGKYKRGVSHLLVLHELAHIAVFSDPDHEWYHASHDRNFCRVLLELVRHEMGDESWRALKAQYRKRKVKHTRYTKRRALTSAEREARTEQLVKARAARKAKAA